MEVKGYKKYPVSAELEAQIAAEIAKIKSLEKAKDFEIAEKLGKTKQCYSTMLNNGLNSLGNIEAIANALGYSVQIKFVKKENV